jgi:four helix bundle protein
MTKESNQNEISYASTQFHYTCMTTPTPRQDLAQRTQNFARDVRLFLRRAKLFDVAAEDIKQLTRSSGSVGANYIEANESLSKKDCGNRLKICRKEAKESGYWLSLMDNFLPGELEIERVRLIKESHELLLIFQSIIKKYYS